jgi:uncharacterized membrane protein
MNRLGFATIVVAVLCALLAPFVVPGSLEAGLAKLGIPGDLAVIYFIAILAGSAINVPIWSFETRRYVRADPLSVLGLEGLLPHLAELRKRAVIAINAGGCIIPGTIAIYEVSRLARGEGAHGALIAVLLATTLNAAACWKVARPVPAVGIALPGAVPVLVSVACALLLQSDQAPPVAFASGVFGPLAGSVARFGFLREQPIAVASIGGAGTFDGIVLVAVASAMLG